MKEIVSVKLNEENFQLLKNIGYKLDYFFLNKPIGGMYDIRLTEIDMIKIMKEMGDDPEYKYLKAELQWYGDQTFWKKYRDEER